MQKVKFRQPKRRTLYIMLCAGILAVGAASVAGYRAAVSSVTDGLITSRGDADVPDIDYSAVDAVLSDIKKDREETAAPEADAAQDQMLPDEVVGLPEEPNNEAIVDITDELEALYYEQAILMPINGEIIAAYSDGELVKSSGGVWRTHDGIDIAAESGAEVRAMTSGTVTEVYEDPLWGCCVVVDHGNTLFGHYFGLSPDVAVTVGDKLNAGDTVGTVGNTADIESDEDSHLHFALKYQSQWIDPIQYIEPMK